jgi:hypothetical protein
LNAVKGFGLREAKCSIWYMAAGRGIASIFFDAEKHTILEEIANSNGKLTDALVRLAAG